MGFADALFRMLPVFRGKQRLARLFFRRRIRTGRNLLVNGRGGNVYKLPNLAENLAFEIFIDGVYEPATSGFIRQRVSRNGCFLDLGANIGAVTVPVVRNRPDVRIVCVEAAPWIYDFLQENLRLNRCTAVTMLNRALYFTDDETLRFYAPEDQFGKGSLSAVFTREWIPVQTIRVDTLISQLGIADVDLIKIDVEGYELHVFRGASELLARSDAPDILFEFVDWAEEQAEGVSPGDAQRYLLEAGYRLYAFDGGVGKELPEPMRKGACLLYASKAPAGTDFTQPLSRPEK